MVSYTEVGLLVKEFSELIDILVKLRLPSTVNSAVLVCYVSKLKLAEYVNKN